MGGKSHAQTFTGSGRKPKIGDTQDDDGSSSIPCVKPRSQSAGW